MRIALIADVHSNAPALEAVVADARAAGAEQVFCAGDVVGFGPSASAVVEQVRALCQVVVRGNHDEALAEGADCRCLPALAPLARAAEALARAQLRPADLAWLRTLPLDEGLYLGGMEVYMVHGSPLDPLYGGVAPDADPARLQREFMTVDSDYVILGHTHRQMALPGLLPKATVINPGSVGFPTDGDPRAAYTLLDTKTGDIQPRRVGYDVRRAVADASALPTRERALYSQVLTRGSLK